MGRLLAKLEVPTLAEAHGVTWIDLKFVRVSNRRARL